MSAADNWDDPVKRKHVRPGMEGSYEALMHQVAIPHFALDLRTDQKARRSCLSAFSWFRFYVG